MRAQRVDRLRRIEAGPALLGDARLDQRPDLFPQEGSNAAFVLDAAMAQRAECVMLNKGPHILEGVDTLVDVIGRMQAHQDKKTPRLRALGSW